MAAAIVDSLTAPTHLLCAARSYPPEHAGQYELPGGKVETGEEPTAVLARELAEELGVRVRLGAELPPAPEFAVPAPPAQATQPGLRGYPAGGYDWMLQVSGDRYDYELGALLAASARGLTVEEVVIEPVYEPSNPTSHFRPLCDSAAIYRPLLRALVRRGVRGVREHGGDSHRGPQPVCGSVRAVRQDRARRLPPRLAV